MNEKILININKKYRIFEAYINLIGYKYWVYILKLTLLFEIIYIGNVFKYEFIVTIITKYVSFIFLTNILAFILFFPSMLFFENI